VVKRGARGCETFQPHRRQTMPPIPVATVDPTGAGDAFAGALAACLLTASSSDFDTGLMQAVAVGTVFASLAVEAFGADGLWQADIGTILARLETLGYRDLLPDRFRSGAQKAPLD
jgi:sugar/nucleoside kinase (ribokinase family)